MNKPVETCTLKKECRNYYLNQAMVKAYEKADACRGTPYSTPAAGRARKQYETMMGQIRHVDQIRSAIRRDFGTETERMFTCCYIDGMNTKNIADRFCLSDDAFRERLHACLEKEESSV